ncbi:hypothetical protein P8V61_25990 [Klebsiella pneumoniae]|uniref:hypothetical protein n=1 Tax=Klebsiella pneumoniae TaxID=573 RepID=UPI002412ADC4|nr:hypothetical protein [Klebsiella pneumoniae]MDG3518190.1 hypothetical protein [Klebsiella pneumoniae]
MVSKFQKKTSTEDLKLVGIFESNLVNIEQLACGDQTKKEWCRIVRRTYQKHLCLYCKDKADSSSTSGEQNNVEKSCPDSPLTNAYDERSDDHKRISLSSGFSSIPDWVQSTRYEPYHFIQIGIAKTKKELPSSKVCKEEFRTQA